MALENSSETNPLKYLEACSPQAFFERAQRIAEFFLVVCGMCQVNDGDRNWTTSDIVEAQEAEGHSYS